MKLALAFLIALASFSTFASTLTQDLSTKDCSIKIKKSVTIKKKEMAAEAGDVSIMALFPNKNIKLSSGKSYPILDVSDGTLAINQGPTLLLVCINDGDSCLKDLTRVNTTDIYQLSDKALEIVCK